MLRVRCAESELQEYGEVIALGDHVSRMAGRCGGAFFGTALDEIEWGFDQYAWLVGGHHAIISGTVAAIDAVYVRLTREPDGWVPTAGTAWREPLTTTAATRKPEEEIEWGPLAEPDANGHSFRSGHRALREGDEQLIGWLITLDDEGIELIAHHAGGD